MQRFPVQMHCYSWRLEPWRTNVSKHHLIRQRTDAVRAPLTGARARFTVTQIPTEGVTHLDIFTCCSRSAQPVLVTLCIYTLGAAPACSMSSGFQDPKCTHDAVAELVSRSYSTLSAQHSTTVIYMKLDFDVLLAEPRARTLASVECNLRTPSS